jgi:hypothetical protein
MTTRNDDLFIVDGLIEPEPTPEMARLLAVLGGYGRNPQATGTKRRQLWELHRTLYGESWVAIDLIAEHYDEDQNRRHLPLPSEVERLAQISWDAWAALLHLGMDVDDMGEPATPAPRQRRRRRTVTDGD